MKTRAKSYKSKSTRALHGTTKRIAPGSLPKKLQDNDNQSTMKAKTHSNMKKFYCLWCSNYYQEELLKHFKCHSNNSAPCSICLMDHGNSVRKRACKYEHTSELSLECEDCDAQFSSVTTLKNHTCILNVVD